MYKRNFINSTIIFAAVIALMTLLSWTVQLTGLAHMPSRSIEMNPATAIFILLLCYCLWKARNTDTGAVPGKAPYIMAAILLVASVIKFLEYLDIISVQFDQVFFPHGPDAPFYHNSIAPTTALLFFLFALLLLNTAIQHRLRRFFNDVLIIVAFMVAYMCVVGFVFGLEQLYRIGPFTPIAITTLTCFIVLLSAQFLLVKDGYFVLTFSSRCIGGKMARRALPLILIVPPAFSYIHSSLPHAYFYNSEYVMVVDTACILLFLLLSVYYYAHELNKSDRKRLKVEAEIRANELKYRTLVHAMKEGVVYYNREGTILFCNESFTRISGYDTTELADKNVVDVFGTDENRAISKKRLEDRRKGIDEEYETQILHKDGSRIIVAITSRTIFIDGELFAFFTTVTDITRRKKEEEDLKAFNSSAAHDLKAPLARIETLSDLLLMQCKDHLQADEVEMLEYIQKTAAGARTMLSDLLYFARIGSEKIEKVPIDMHEMARRVVADCLFLNPDVSVTIDELPEAHGSPAAIKQVWANLVGNAIKYSSRTPQAAVHIGYTAHNGTSCYFVRDNGIGFEMSKAQKVFTPFYRMTSDFEGTGLGLPIVRRVLEKHNGNIWAESEPGKGSTFYFTV